MNKILIGNIEILYDEYDDVEINRIREIILNNPILLADKCSVNINDFDSYFKRIATDIYSQNNEIFSNKDWLPALYITSLSKNNPEYKNAIVKIGEGLSNEVLQGLIAYKYYEGKDSLDDFVNYLMYRRDTDKIMEWLYNNYRWDTKNYLIEVVCNGLKDFDSKFFNVLPDMIDDFSQRAVERLISNDSARQIDLPKISYDELDKLFCDFLYYIEAPQDWLNSYLELKEDGKIKFVDVGQADSECVCDVDGTPLYLVIEDDGTIDVFYTLVHEFTHYISLKSGFVPFSILEFPSIFFEKIATRFLKGEGYSDEVILSVVRMRDENSHSIFVSLLPIFNAVKDYINSGYSHTSREDTIKAWQEYSRIVREAEEKLGRDDGEASFFEDTSYSNIEDLVDGECDSLISDFTKNGLLAIDGCQYILGTYLALGIIEKSENDNNLDNVSLMVEVTSRLADYNLENILTLFDMEDLFSRGDDSSKKLIKSKD